MKTLKNQKKSKKAEQRSENENITPSPTADSKSNPTDIDARIRSIVREELSRLLKGIEPVSIQKSGRGGKSATAKKSFSIPSDLWAEVESLGGIASNHVAAALRIYLRLRHDGILLEDLQKTPEN